MSPMKKSVLSKDSSPEYLQPHRNLMKYARFHHCSKNIDSIKMKRIKENKGKSRYLRPSQLLSYAKRETSPLQRNTKKSHSICNNASFTYNTTSPVNFSVKLTRRI